MTDVQEAPGATDTGGWDVPEPQAANRPVAATALEADTAAALRLGVMRLARRLRVERDGNDLTFNQLAALGTLRHHGPLTVGEMAGHENVKPPSMTRTVAALEEAGLVTRRPSTTDGRQVVVELTDHAVRVMDEDRVRRTAWLAQRLGELSPAEGELLARVAPLLERQAGA